MDSRLTKYCQAIVELAWTHVKVFGKTHNPSIANAVSVLEAC